MERTSLNYICKTEARENEFKLFLSTRDVLLIVKFQCILCFMPTTLSTLYNSSNNILDLSDRIFFFESLYFINVVALVIK